MDEQTPVTTEPAKPMSFTDKMINIFAAPGELFEDVRLTPPTMSNWLVPMLLFIVVAFLMSQVMFMNPSILSQMTDLVTSSIDKMVAEGKLTPEQAEQAINMSKPGSTMFMIQQVVGILILTPVVLFLLSLIYWLLGKWGMKATAPFMKVVEVLGLTFFISIAESIVTTILMFVMDSITATPSLGAFVSNFDYENKLHMALAKINIFTFWDLTVVSIGLSRLFQRHLPKVLVIVFALWVVWTVFAVMMNIKTG
ncbi:MAG: YIP1 family protein [Bacteroidetes bacterium]|nr:YIP1 family protein [Bacteroidota bacterium]